MFCCPRRRHKNKCRDDVEAGDKLRSSPHKSVIVEEDPKQDAVVPDTQATTVSAQTEAPKEKAKKAPWWLRRSSRKTKTKEQTHVKEDVAEDTNLPSSDTEKSVITVTESEGGEAGVQEYSPSPDDSEAGVQEASPSPDDSEAGVQEASPNPEGGEAGVQEASPNPGVQEASPNPEGSEAGVQEASPNPGVQEASPNSEGGKAGVQEASPNPGVQEASPNPEGGEAGVQEASPNHEGSEAGVQEASPSPDSPVSAASEIGGKKKKKPWWRRWLLSCRRKQNLQSPVETNEGAERSPTSTSTKTDSNVVNLPPGKRVTRKPTPTGQGGSQQVQPDNTGLLTSIQGQPMTSASKKTLSRKELVCLGFPNLAQTRYMNSTLQSLLTLSPFVEEVHNQQEVWSSHPESQLIRRFVEVGVCRFSNNKAEKKGVLASFKKTVAEFNSEFEDNHQKDAHEFLICVLDQMRSLSAHLHTAAVDVGISYTCPVSAHIAFQMLSTRTCKGCGMQSMRQEDYMNLALDLVPGGSVSQCLQEYLKESQLEYRCECGAEESSQKWSFLTLPNVLILQLQRFRFTQSFNLEKVNSPIVLSRELELNPESSIIEQTTTDYSLVSIVSHLGSTAHSGHYICDSAHREQKPGAVTECWLTYNDKDVSEKTGTSVCRQRRRTAYLLFYEKQQ